MQIASNHVRTYLANNLPIKMVVYGDEHLLHIEACEYIRELFEQSGYEERKVVFADQSFNWLDLNMYTSNLSLFSTKQLIDIRIQNGKPGLKGATALIELGETDLRDTAVLISIPASSREISNSKWFKTLDKNFLMIHARKMERETLPQWIKQKFQAQKQSTSKETIEFIVDRVEGNLMAAYQEIKKLGLLLPQGHIEHAQVKAALRDVSRFDISDIGFTILTRNRKAYIKVVRALNFEGVAAPLVLWSVMQEIRSILAVQTKISSGLSMANALRAARCWGVRKQIIPKILPFIDKKDMMKIMQEGHEVDLIIKGLIKGDAWDALTQLGISSIKTIDNKLLKSAALIAR